MAEAEYGDGARQWRNPDVMGNVYDSTDRTDRTYARGGQLREDRRWRYHYDKQGNLVLKTKRKIRADLEHAVSQTEGKGFFGLFSNNNTSKERREQEELIAWHPGDYAYTWLPNGMLGSVTRPDGKVVTFKYDALGRRVEKTFNGRVHRYLWDGDVVLHEWEYDETERPQPIVAENGDVSFDRPEPTDNLVTWVYDPDSYVPTAKLVNGKRYGIASDYIGRPVQAYDEHGTLVWQADYDIYGNLLNRKGDRGFVPFRQLGQYEDEETGLYYNRFRYYDPSTGGYISQDPIRLEGNNPTLYGYTRDSNTRIDLWGLDCDVPKKTQTHHIIPMAVYKAFRKDFKKIKGYVQAVNVRTAKNRTNLIDLDTPFHGNHPKYNEYVSKKITKLTNEGDLKLDDINTLQNNLRNEIGKAQASGKNQNEHFGKLK